MLVISGSHYLILLVVICVLSETPTLGSHVQGVPLIIGCNILTLTICFCWILGKHIAEIFKIIYGVGPV